MALAWRHWEDAAMVAVLGGWRWDGSAVRLQLRQQLGGCLHVGLLAAPLPLWQETMILAAEAKAAV